MSKSFIIYLLFLGSTSSLLAQNNLSGKIIDADGNGLPYVTIRQLHLDSTFISGTVTDSLGNYKIINNAIDKFLLAVSCIGYDTHILSINTHNKEEYIKPIILTTNNVLLNEVEVNARSYIRKDDHVLIIPDKQQVKHARTGYDLLHNLMIPSIKVDKLKGEVTTFGGNVTLYIDGRKVDYREIQSLRAQDIQKVEYFDAPTGKYAGDIASINYITKQQKIGGYVSFDGKQTIGYLNGDYNIVGKLSHGNTSYILFGGYSMEEYGGVKSENHEDLYFPEYTVKRDYRTDNAKIKNNQRYAQFNVINQNNKRTLMGKVSLVQNDEPDNFTDNSMRYSGHYDKSIKTHRSTDEYSTKPTINLYGNFDLKHDQELETSLGASTTQNKYSRDYSENDFFSHTDAKEKFYTMDVSINYNKRLKHQNSFTTQLLHFHKISSSSYTGDYNYWQHLWTAETLLFFVYNQTFSKKTIMNVRTGISSLQYRLHGEDHISRISPRFNLKLTYNITHHQQLRWAVNIGNTFPSISVLNKVDQNIDYLTIERGNPNLDKANIYNTSLTYNLQVGKFNIHTMANYQCFTNYTFSNYYTEGNKLINSYLDGGNFHNIDGLLSMTWKASKHLHIKGDLNWTRSIAEGTIKASRNSFYAALDINYFWKDFAFNIYATSSSRGLSSNPAYTKEYSEYGTSLSYNHKGWNAEIGTENPFSKNCRNNEYADFGIYKYNLTKTSRIYQQTGYIKLAYTIDFGRKTSRTYEKVNTNVNSAILKVK